MIQNLNLPYLATLKPLQKSVTDHSFLNAVFWPFIAVNFHYNLVASHFETFRNIGYYFKSTFVNFKIMSSLI